MVNYSPVIRYVILWHIGSESMTMLVQMVDYKLICLHINFVQV